MWMLLLACQGTVIEEGDDLVLDDDPVVTTDTDTAGPCADSDGETATSVPLEALHTVGRFDRTADTLPLHWPGSTVALSFCGTGLSVSLDEAGDNYLNIIVDGGEPVVLDPTAGVASYTLAEGLDAGPHSVELRKRGGVWEGDVSVLEVEVQGGSTLLDWPEPDTRLAFYGDSITVGYSAECECNEGLSQYKNHDLTYAALATRALGGEHQAIAISGLGIHTSWWDGDYFDYWDQVRYDGTAGSYDVAGFDPEFVVLNLGQNDYWLGVREEIVAAYVRAATLLRAEHPEAHLVLALGSMDAVEDGSPMPDYLREAVAQLEDAGDDRVYALVFDYNGWGGHPVEDDHAVMATKLVTTLEALR